MAHRTIICVDMDEVIADALGEHLQRYNRDFACNVTPDDLRGQWLWDFVPPERRQSLIDSMLSEDFFSSLDVMPHAQHVLARLQERYDLFIATAAMEVPSSFNAKYHWLARHFPFIPHTHIVFCGDKSILRADFLIDDNPRQLRLFEGREAEKPASARTESSARRIAARMAELDAGRNPQPTREGILFSSPSNHYVTGFRRVNDWLDVEKMFLG